MKTGLYYICSLCLYWVASPLIQSLSFLTYTLLGYTMTAEVAFTTMSVTSLFDQPLIFMPGAVSQTMQIMVSLHRIEKFLYV